jgi:hypothetical protein
LSDKPKVRESLDNTRQLRGYIRVAILEHHRLGLIFNLKQVPTFRTPPWTTELLIKSIIKTILVDAVGKFVIEGEGVYQSMFELLEKYPNKKIILTNANDEQLVPFSLVSLPYGMFTMKHNPDKVDPVYFETMLKQYNLTVDDVIYFEHNPDAVKSAGSVGIIPYFYDADKKDLDGLKTFFDKNA